MKKLAWAVLVQGRANERLCTLELIELGLPGGEGDTRYVVTRRDQMLDQGVVRAESDGTLTAMPVSLPVARRRAIEYLQRRLSAGDALREQSGFDELRTLVEGGGSAAAAGAASAAASSFSPSRPSAPTSAPPSPEVAALAARFEPSAWRLLTPARQARSVWRVAERADRARAEAPDQQALRALVPRLVGLIESGEDLLDYCLAAAIARLGDPGARQAMAALSERGRSAATRRIADQAWLLLSAGDTARAERLRALSENWWARYAEMMVRAGAAASPSEAQAAQEEGTQPELDGSERDALAEWLLQGYDVALIDARALQSVRACLRHVRFEAGVFVAVRAIHKTAELRADLDTLALLHARFESTRSQPRERMAWRNPQTGELMTRARDVRGGKGLISAYGSATRDYLRLRGLRQVRRLAALNHSDAAPLAVALLLELNDDIHAGRRQEERWRYVQADGRYQRQTRYLDGAAHWMLVSQLLLPRWPDLHRSNTRASLWWTDQPLPLGQLLRERVEGEQAMWDAHPQALLTLAQRSRSALVQWVVARALRDHLPFLAGCPVPALQPLLSSPYEHTASVGVAAVRDLLEGLSDMDDRLPWLIALAGSRYHGAAVLLSKELNRHGAELASRASLVVALLLSPQASLRVHGQALAAMADVPALLVELQQALPLLDDDTPDLPGIAQHLQELLAGHWAPYAAKVPAPPLHALLDHRALPLAELACTWLLQHPEGLATLPPATLRALLASSEPRRCACGLRLLGQMPDAVLRSQAALLAEFALHPDPVVRAALATAIERLAQDADASRELAEHLHAALFRSEPADGVHDDLLRWLTGPLAPVAPGRDPEGCWRALQARATGAQRYGAWALQGRSDADFSLRQWARLVCHADATVRQRAVDSLDGRLGTPVQATTEQAAELLPAADSVFEDVQPWVRRLFGERLPDAALTPELLIAWVDHPQPWVQAQGRSRLMGRMSAPEASLCLTRLAQHPGTSVQLFVTQWLLQLPQEEDEARAQRLRQLQPYFLTVLSQVHRARAAKSRIVDFLRQQIAGPACAEVVAAIFARQVVGASRTDQPQYIAGLRDISSRHPHLELPFLRWVSPEARTAAKQGAKSDRQNA